MILPSAGKGRWLSCLEGHGFRTGCTRGTLSCSLCLSWSAVGPFLLQVSPSSLSLHRKFCHLPKDHLRGVCWRWILAGACSDRLFPATCLYLCMSPSPVSCHTVPPPPAMPGSSPTALLQCTLFACDLQQGESGVANNEEITCGMDPHCVPRPYRSYVILRTDGHHQRKG